MNGIEQPNYTQVPNVLFEAMATMTESELKCTLAIVRQIIGFHKEKPEPVSYTQIQKMTGLSRQAVTDGVRASVERGYVVIAGKGKRGANLYSLNFIDQSTQWTSTSQPSRPELVYSVDTQKKGKENSKEKNIPPKADTGTPPPSEDVSDAESAPLEEVVNHQPPDVAEPKRSAKQQRLDSFIEAMIAALKWNRENITDPEWGLLRKSGSELLRAGATEDDLPGLVSWCDKQNWSNWGPRAMATNWSNYCKARPKPAPTPTGPTPFEASIADAIDAVQQKKAVA